MKDYDEYDLAGLKMTNEQKVKARLYGITPQTLVNFQQSSTKLAEAFRNIAQGMVKQIRLSTYVPQCNKVKDWNKERFYD